MEIINIQGNSEMIRGGTNTGLYRFENGEVLLVDVGHTVARGNRMAKLLIRNALKPAYAFVTHEHYDHLEALAGILEEFPSCRLIAHPTAKLYIENLYLGKAYLYSGEPPNFFWEGNGTPGEAMEQRGHYVVHQTAEEELFLNGERFEIVHLPGHCPGQAVLITPDKVAYLGDLLMDHRIIDIYDMPFLFSVELQERSLRKLWEMDFEYGLIGHCKRFYTRDEILSVARRNLEVLARYERDILELLAKERTREELLAILLVRRNIDCSFSSYHYNNSTLGAFLAKFSNERKIKFQFREGRIYYRRTEGNDGI